MDHTPATAGTASAPRLAGLDALRGIAACVVAFGFHAQFMFAKGVLPADAGGAIGQWLRDFGWTAVDLFFILSGYVFAHVYIRGTDTRGFALGDFAVARIARLYPLHLLTLLACALLFGSLPDNTAGAFAAHLMLGQALFPPTGHTFNGPTWSISVEAICYLLFALGLWWRGWALPVVTALAILIGLVGTQVFVEGHELTVAGALSRGLFGFFLGQALWRGRDRFVRVPSAALALIAVTGLILDPDMVSPVIPLNLLTWPALVLLAMRLSLMSSPLLVWLGDRSYAIYLIHMPIVDLVYFSNHGGLHGGTATLVAAYAGLIVLTLVLSDLAHRLFELPARSWLRDAWRSRVPQVRQARPYHR